MRTVADYLQHLQSHVPPGPAWPLEADALLTRRLAVVAEELAMVDGRAVDLIAESDPRTALEMLDAWERVCGLPDSCAAAAVEGLDARRAAVVAKLTEQRGQSRAYLVGLAAGIGRAITIQEYRPAVCGQARCGDAVLRGPHAIRHTWRTHGLTTSRLGYARAGAAICGKTRLGDFARDVQVECRLARAAPAHTRVWHRYTIARPHLLTVTGARLVTLAGRALTTINPLPVE